MTPIVAGIGNWEWGIDDAHYDVIFGLSMNLFSPPVILSEHVNRKFEQIYQNWKFSQYQIYLIIPKKLILE